jgi:glycosyltransferase involved in cell wall biosynthesis
MRILVIEHSHLGHRFVHLRMLLPALCELSDSVTLAIPKDALDTDEYCSQLARFEGQIEIDAWLPSHKHFSSWRKPAEVRESIRRSGADYVYVPHADGYAQIIGLCRCLCLPTIPKGVELEALVMRGAFVYPQKDIIASLKAALSMWLVLRGPWSRLHLLDPLVYDAVKSKEGCIAHKVSLIPDPVPNSPDITRAEACRLLDIPQDGRYIVAAGALDERKGTDLLVHAFSRAELTESDRLLLVGRLAPNVRDLVERVYQPLVANGRIIMMDRFVSDKDFELAILAADVVCTPYRSHIGSASIAIRAAEARRFVLASAYGWLGNIVPGFGLGYVCETESPDIFSKAIVSAFEAAAEHLWSESAKRFVAFHTAENFASVWTERLCKVQGRVSDRVWMTWEKVIGDDDVCL